LIGGLARRDVALVAGHGLALEARHGNTLHVGERVIRRAREHEMIVADRDDDDLRMLLRIGDDAEIDLLRDDVLVDLVWPRVFDVNVHLWVLAQVFLQIRRQLVQADAIDDGNAQMAADHRAAVL
jgi:hypothetical protein